MAMNTRDATTWQEYMAAWASNLRTGVHQTWWLGRDTTPQTIAEWASGLVDEVPQVFLDKHNLMLNFVDVSMSFRLGKVEWQDEPTGHGGCIGHIGNGPQELREEIIRRWHYEHQDWDGEHVGCKYFHCKRVEALVPDDDEEDNNG